MKFLREHFQIIKHAGLALFAFTALYNLLDQILTLKIEANLSNPSGPSSSVWYLAGSSLLISIFLPVLIQFFALYGISKNYFQQLELKNYFQKNLSQLYIETLRSWGKSMLWGFVFLIPGFVRYFEYYYVPFVVTSLKSYDEGKIDALEISRKLVKKHWLKLSLVLAVFQIIVPVINKTIFDEYSLFFKTPLTAILLSAIDTIIFIIATQILYRLFIQTLEEEKDGTLFSMERY